MLAVQQIKLCFPGNTSAIVNALGFFGAVTICQEPLLFLMIKQGSKSGNPRPVLQYPPVNLWKHFDISAKRRPWPNKADVTGQDVPKLRQLVDAELSHPMTHGGDPAGFVAA